MAPPSPFDELLNEFDDPLTSRRPPEDPLRGENLQKLLALSKQLETIAKTLDPSDAKHPLNEQTVPEEARARLKGLVGELMRVQGELHEIEKALLESEKEPLLPDHTPEERPSRDDFSAESTRPERARHDPLDSFDALPPRPVRRVLSPSISPMPDDIDAKQDQNIPTLTPPPLTKHPSALDHSLNIAPAAPESEESPSQAPARLAPPTPPTPSAEQEELKKEKAEFEAYKTQWEAAFSANPALRADHPEVQQYYQQMEAYFKEKEAYLAKG